MTFKPWDCAQPDEWLPRSLRLCWGGDSSGGGFGDSSGGGGFGDAGFSATTGGGDWGSAGGFDASGFNATGDVNAYAGTAYDASTSGTGMGAGGDWGSFAATNYSGMNAPNPIFTDIAGPNPGVTTGGGDWGSAGTFSAAGTGGGPGGAMSFGTGGGLYGGGGTTDGGGLFGDYGGGGGSSYGGGGGSGVGGGRGGSPFGSFGTVGTVGPSNIGRGSERSASEPAFADTAGSAGGRGAGSAVGGRITSDAPTRSEAEVASVVSADPDADPEGIDPGSAQYGTPTTSEPDTPAPEQSAPEQSAPEASRGDAQAQPTASRGDRGADPEGIDPGSAQYGVFGPQSLAYQQAAQQLSDLTQTGLSPQDVNWGSVFEAPSQAPQDQGKWSDLPGIYYTGISNMLPNLDPRTWVETPAWAQNQPTPWEAMQPGGPLSAVGKAYDFLSNLPNTLNPNNWVTPSGLHATAFDQQSRGEQGKAGRLDSFDSRFGFDPNTDTTNWGAVFEGATPAAPDTTDWSSVFEGGPTGPDWGSVFEGAAPALDARSSIEAFIAGGRNTDFANENAPGGRMEASIPGGRATNFDYNIAPAPQDQPQTDQPQADQPVDVELVSPNDPVLANMPAIPQGPDWGSVFEGAAPPSAPQSAQPPQDAQLQGGTSIPGGRSTDFNYGPAGGINPSILPEQSSVPITLEAIANAVRGVEADLPGSAQPSLVDMAAQPGAGRSEASIPGGRGTDWSYTPASTGRGIDPGIGPGVEVDDDDAPEPQDSIHPPGDPNAPRPPGNIPGQVIGANGQYDNAHLDNPRVNKNYLDSGRTDYPQGKPGVTYRTARQAGIEPLFRVGDMPVGDVDARLIENVNRALREMERTTGIPANSLVSTSAYRPAHRGEAHERGLDPRLSQESVRSRGVPSSGRGFPAARPGNSNHGHGRSLDFSPKGESGRALAWLREHAHTYGLEHLGFKNGKPFDLPHIQLRGAAGNVGPRPSAQEQAEQRAIDTQNRQAAIDRGLIGGGRTQVAGVPLPRGRPGDAPQTEIAQPDVPATPTAAALPPPEAPLNAPRPQADIPIDIPVQTVPPGRGRLDPTVQTQNALNLIKQSTAKLTTSSGQAEFNAAGVVAAKDLAKAGVPLAMARNLMTQSAYQGAEKVGYGPSATLWSIYKGHIDDGINAALQGYAPAKQGEAQGPPAPADLVAPGKRSEAPSLFDLLNMFNPISTAEARGGRSQAGNLQAPRADPGVIQGRLSEARSDIVNELQTNQGLRNTLDLIVTGEVGSQGRAAVLGFLETAMNKVAAEASRQGREANGRDLLNYLNDRSYFPDTWGKIESGKVRGGALTDDLIGAIGAGSNTTGLSTGNSSAKSSGSRFGGNPTNATIGKEYYGVENYSHHAAWYNAMGAPAPGRGIGSDYAAGPYDDAAAVGAMPTQDAPLRGLAKGGHVAEDETVVVGERGPEYFVPDWSRPVFHVPQPGQPGNVDRWPKVPAPEYPGQYGGVEREIRRQMRAAQDMRPGLIDMINRGQLRFNPTAWDRWLNDPKDVALGWSRIEDRR